MTNPLDPFTFHPELRDKIRDPFSSFFREFDAKEIFQSQPELLWVLDELHSDEQRNASRKAVIEQQDSDDLWVFAYGSLMWDPAIVFSEVRRAFVPDYARKFILKDVWGGRGTREVPGLMAALDKGDGCQGLVYRIAAENIETETDILWRREMLGPGYLPVFVTTQVGGTSTQALAFVADYDVDTVEPNLDRSEQVKCLATGAGLLGTNLEYLQNIVDQFAVLGVTDDYCSTLLQDVQHYMQANTGTMNGTRK